MSRTWVFLGLLGCLISSTFAATTGFNCVNASYQIQGKNILLVGTDSRKQSMVYFFKNKSNQSIWIDHPNLNPGASAGWSTYLRPNHWSALVINKKDFVIDCAMMQPGKLVYLDCSHVLEVCAPKAGVTTSHKGNFWLVEDKPGDVFVQILEKKGL